MGRFKRHGRINKPNKKDEWNNGWWPDKIGSGEIYSGEDPGHHRQIHVILEDFLIKAKRYGINQCSQNLLHLIANRTIGQFMSVWRRPGSRLWHLLPSNTCLGEMLGFDQSYVRRSLKQLLTQNLIIKIGYRERWVCIHPRLYGMNLTQVKKQISGWPDIIPDYNWRVNVGKKKMWWADPDRKKKTGKGFRDEASFLNWATFYAGEKIEGLNGGSKQLRQKMISCLEQLTEWWVLDKWGEVVEKIFSPENMKERGLHYSDPCVKYLKRTRGPQNLMGYFIDWLSKKQANGVYPKISPGSFDGDGKLVRNFYKEFIQYKKSTGISLATLLKDYKGGSEPLEEVLKEDQDWLQKNGRRRQLGKYPDGRVRATACRTIPRMNKK
ncbi:MAG: hypothetical protein P8185_11215 [Deltaproteobacteria bacterium]|jgi:hypothetical protein